MEKLYFVPISLYSKTVADHMSDNNLQHRNEKLIECKVCEYISQMIRNQNHCHCQISDSIRTVQTEQHLRLWINTDRTLKEWRHFLSYSYDNLVPRENPRNKAVHTF